MTRSRLLTVGEVAERLNTGPRYIRRLVFERRTPYVKVGALVRFEETDVEAFVQAGRVPATARRRGAR